MHNGSVVRALVVLAAATFSLCCAAGAADAPPPHDENTLFLARFDGNTAENGLAADVARGEVAPMSASKCSLSGKGEGRYAA